MQTSVIIYKILHALDMAAPYDELDEKSINPESLETTTVMRDRLLIELQRCGYISGLEVKKVSNLEIVAKPINPRLTVKGAEYLCCSPLMGKAVNNLYIVARGTEHEIENPIHGT